MGGTLQKIRVKTVGTVATLPSRLPDLLRVSLSHCTLSFPPSQPAGVTCSSSHQQTRTKMAKIDFWPHRTWLLQDLHVNRKCHYYTSSDFLSQRKNTPGKWIAVASCGRHTYTTGDTPTSSNSGRRSAQGTARGTGGTRWQHCAAGELCSHAVAGLSGWGPGLPGRAGRVRILRIRHPKCKCGGH